MISENNHYATLGVAKSATKAQITAAYKKLAMKYHPDKAAVNGLDPLQAQTKFQKIEAAYAVLKEPDSRRNYDYSLNQPSLSQSSSTWTYSSTPKYTAPPPAWQSASNPSYQREPLDPIEEILSKISFCSIAVIQAWYEKYKVQPTHEMMLEALKFGNFSVIPWFIDKKFDINTVFRLNGRPTTFFKELVANNNLDAIKYILGLPGFNVHGREFIEIRGAGQYPLTPLEITFYADNVAAVRLLVTDTNCLKNFMIVNAWSSRCERMPLLNFAALKGKTNTLRYLISIGVNVNAVDGCGRDVLYYMLTNAYCEHISAYEILIAAGLDVCKPYEKADGSGVEYALELAASKGNSEIVRKLLAALTLTSSTALIIRSAIAKSTAPDITGLLKSYLLSRRHFNLILLNYSTQRFSVTTRWLSSARLIEDINEAKSELYQYLYGLHGAKIAVYLFKLVLILFVARFYLASIFPMPPALQLLFLAETGLFLFASIVNRNLKDYMYYFDKLELLYANAFKKITGIFRRPEPTFVQKCLGACKDIAAGLISHFGMKGVAFLIRSVPIVVVAAISYQIAALSILHASLNVLMFGYLGFICSTAYLASLINNFSTDTKNLDLSMKDLIKNTYDSIRSAFKTVKDHTMKTAIIMGHAMKSVINVMYKLTSAVYGNILNLFKIFGRAQQTSNTRPSNNPPADPPRAFPGDGFPEPQHPGMFFGDRPQAGNPFNASNNSPFSNGNPFRRAVP